MYMAHERRAHILRLLAERGSIRSAALAAELGVTDETIRTDLVLLEREGQLRRRHGGAEFLPLPCPADSSSHAARLDYQLAAALLPHIPAGARLMVDASRFSQTLLGMLHERELTILSHAPELLQQFAAGALPHRLLCPGGELDKASCRLLPPAGAVEAAAPTLAVLSPERVEMRGSELALAYKHRADQLWAQEAIEHTPALLLAFPASVLAEWSGSALPCSPRLVVTEDNLPADAEPRNLHLVPWLDPATLLPEDAFDY